MAKLILTDKEKEAKSLLEWPDESLGKAVRYCITTLMPEAEKGAVFAITCGQILCSLATEINATEMTLKLDGVTYGEKKLGDWEIFVNKK